MVKCSLFVWSEAHPGQEEIYNDWYDNVHLADVCSLPGYTGAKRYSFAAATPTPCKYLAIYDLETESPDTVIEELMARTANMELSPAINVESVVMNVMIRR